MSINYGKGGIASGSALYGLGGSNSGSKVYTTEIAAADPDTSWTQVIFDGTNDYLSTGAPLTGLADGPTGTVAFRVASGADGTWKNILRLTGDRFKLLQSTSNSYSLEVYNSAATKILYMLTSAVVVTDGMTTVLMSWDLTTAAAELCHQCINDVCNTDFVTKVAGNVDYSTTTGVGAFASDTGVTLYNGNAEFLWFDDTYIDLSVSTNRDKFLQVNIGTTGEGPTGLSPIIYLTGSASEWNDAGGINLGTGGPFYMSGEVVNA